MSSENAATVEAMVVESTNETMNAEAAAPTKQEAQDTATDNLTAMDLSSVVKTDVKASEPTPAVEGETVKESVTSETTVQKDAEIILNEHPEVTDTNAEITPADKSESKNKPAAIILHHLNNSRSQRFLWLLEELDIPYDIKKYQRTAEMLAPESLKKVHPLGKSPIITDGTVTLAESGAITQYLLEKYGAKFRPTEDGRIDDLYFTHYAEGSLMPLVVNKYVFTLIPRRSPALIRPLIKSVFSTIEKKMLIPQLKAHCELIESHLKKSKTGWLAGGDHPTSADFMMVFNIEILVASSGDIVGPKTKEYVKRIHERPAYKRGLEKGGKYDYAKL